MSPDGLLDHPDNVLNRLSLPAKARGDLLDVSILPVRQPERPKRYPTELRVVSGALAHLTSERSAAAELDVSLDMVVANKKSQAAMIDDVLGRLKDKAAERMGYALDEITPELLKAHAKKDVRVASGVAKDMASIFEKVTPKFGDDNRTQVNVYVPIEAKEEDYKKVQIALNVAER